ncbi:MAG: hypothetical protein ACYCW6_10525 [Candidatus Xenobia bacterium]
MNVVVALFARVYAGIAVFGVVVLPVMLLVIFFAGLHGDRAERTVSTPAVVGRLALKPT